MDPSGTTELSGCRIKSTIQYKSQSLDRAHRAEIKPIFNDRYPPPFNDPLNPLKFEARAQIVKCDIPRRFVVCNNLRGFLIWALWNSIA